MSLTERVKATAERDPLRGWFDARFPAVSNMAGHYRDYLAEHPILVSQGPSAPALVGSAFDLRARLYLRPEHAQLDVARRGGRELGGIYNIDTQTWSTPPLDRFFGQVEGILDVVDPVTHRLDDENERRLSRACVILARLEYFASGRPRATGDTGKLGDVPDETVDEMVALLGLFAARFSTVFDQPIALQPAFEGSSLVGGANADFVGAGTLLEIKTTTGALPAWTVRQVLGYALLDFSDTYAMDSIGFYFARHGLVHWFNIGDFLDLATGGKAATIQELRADLRSFLERGHPSPTT